MTAHSPFPDGKLSTTVAVMKEGQFLKPWFSPELTDLLSKMLEFDPGKRIKLRKIWEHPLVTKWAPADRLPGRPADIISGAVGIADCDGPLLKEDDEVDAITMGNLIGLHPGMDETHIYHQLRTEV